MGFYESKRRKADALIAKRGLSMTLRRVTKGEYDASQGLKAESSSKDYPCKGIIEEYRIKDIDGTIIKQGDKKIILSAENLTIRPEANDLLIISGETWKIVINRPTSPAGVDVVHNLQIRS